MITLIAAMDRDRVIGDGNQLIWNMPSDMERFRQLTAGHAVIMGRKTFESMGKPLPKRTNIIVTRNTEYRVAGAMVVATMEQAVKNALAVDADPFIIGGQEIYQLAIDQGWADQIFLTVVETSFKRGDAFFPKIDLGVWSEVERAAHKKDARNPHDYTYITYRRRKST